MRDSQSSARSRRRSQRISTILFIAALVFAAAAVVIWIIGDAGPDRDPPVPTAIPGQYNLANVLEELEAAGLDGDYGRSPATVESSQIETPGQHLKVEGQSLWVFLFTGPNGVANREAAGAALDPATMTLLTPTSGNDVTDGAPITIAQGANVIVALVGGDPALQAAVQDVIEGLAGA
jgi:hypothetical protein